MDRMKDKAVLVAAAANGIGLATATACAKEGATVYLADYMLDLAKERAADLTARGYKAHALYFNALEKNTHAAIVEEVVKNEGKIDGLVNVYGGTTPAKDKSIFETNYEDYIGFVDNHLASVFLASQAAVRSMAQTGGGSIVNIVSLAGVVPDLTSIAYGTSKAAIIYLTKQIAVQAARANIRCNSVAPGMTATDAVKKYVTAEFQEFFLRHTPIKRLAEPEEMAAAVLYFLSDESAFTTGQNITLSGGFGLAQPTFADMLAMAGSQLEGQ